MILASARKETLQLALLAYKLVSYKLQGVYRSLNYKLPGPGIDLKPQHLAPAARRHISGVAALKLLVRISRGRSIQPEDWLFHLITENKPIMFASGAVILFALCQL